MRSPSTRRIQKRSLRQAGAKKTRRFDLGPRTCVPSALSHLVSVLVVSLERTQLCIFLPNRCASKETMRLRRNTRQGITRPQFAASDPTPAFATQTPVALSYYSRTFPSDRLHHHYSAGLRLCRPLDSCSIVAAKLASWVVRTPLEGNRGQTDCNGTFTADQSATAAQLPPHIQTTTRSGTSHHR